ncbi:MAG: hypothetical protein HY040_22315 [Planctomycetes bacterium]|nr:hypothetical protein [Planctomycetota bacterium]
MHTILAAEPSRYEPLSAELPVSPEASSEESPAGTMSLVEMLLKSERRVDRINRDPANQRELFPRFLLISQISTLAFALVMVLVMNLAPSAIMAPAPGLAIPPADWKDGSALALPLAYNLSIVLAACVCLPSFYFFSLLAGVQITWLQIVSIVGKGMAASAILLLGILPIYVAIVLGMVVLDWPAENLQWTLRLGLLLPFVAGLWGLRAIYGGVMDLNDWQHGPACANRRCFLRRLTLAWAAVYTAVLPVMIYRLWETFAFHT